MRKITRNSISIIIIYIFLLSSAFIISLFFLQKQMNSYKGLSSSIVYQPKGTELFDVYNNGLLNMQLEKTVDGGEIENYYNKVFSDALPIVVIPFCIFLIFSSFILGWILINIQRKEARKVIESFKSLGDDKILSDNDLINDTYESLKEKFNEHLNSYKRLHSYLSHEQKNLISVLKASLEVENNITYLSCLDSLTNSIDDVLTLSDNEDISSLSEVDVALVCASVCDSYKKISKIHFDFIEDDNTYILAKERWIYRAISNLVDNAIKYSDGKEVSVCVKNHNHSVIVVVSDQGIGISKEYLDRIFEHKYRINELNKNGYGIGLSLVSHVCNLCSGFVWVESEVNRGSKFYLSFPEF